MGKDLVGASNIDDGLGIVSSFSPVSQFSTALPGIPLCLRLFSRHHLITVCSHDYSPQFLRPHGVGVLGQLRDLAIYGLES